MPLVIVLSCTAALLAIAVLGLAIGERREASLVATALGATLGCRVVRVHDVCAHRQVCDVLAAVGSARS